MRYVKLAYGCELKKVGNVIFLYDLLNSKTYKIFDDKEVRICMKIFSDSIYTEEDIYLEFGNDWMQLKKDLESNNLIRYSDNQSNFKDEWDLGTKCMLTKDYMSCRAVINAAYINISNLCNMNCVFCNNLSNFDCVTCRKDSNYDFANAQYFPDLISKLKIYGLRNIYFCGADPLLDIELIKKYINDVHGNISACIISNGILLYNNTDFISYMQRKNISLMLQIVSNDNEYREKIFAVIEELRNYKINFSVLLKCMSDSAMLDYLNKNKIWFDCIKFVNKDYAIDKECFYKPIDLQTNTIFNNNHLCLYSKIFIEPNGNVKNCFHMDVIGNLNTDNLGDIVSKLSANWSNPDIENEKCIACDLRKYCTVCTYVRKNGENQRSFCYINKEKM